MISKELLSEVLASPTKVDYYGLSLFGYGDNNLMFNWKSSIDGTEVRDSINIYELAHKCKEWANTKGYVLETTARTNSCFAICNFSLRGKHDYTDDLWSNFRAETEPGAVFAACQWILSNRSSQCQNTVTVI